MAHNLIVCKRRPKSEGGWGGGRREAEIREKNGALRRDETIFIHIEQDTCSSFSRALDLQIVG